MARNGLILFSLSGSVFLAAATFTADAAHAVSLFSQTLSFNTPGPQSAWGPGAAQRYSGFEDLTIPWRNVSESVGTIEGSASTPNPACEITGPVPCFPETIDTRTGAKVSVRTSGKAGFNVSYLADAGSVEAAFDMEVSAIVPGSVKKGEYFDLGPSRTVTTSRLTTRSPTVEARIYPVVDFDATVDMEGCLIGFGCDRTIFTDIGTDVIGQQELMHLTPNRVYLGQGFGLPVDVSFNALETELSFGVDVLGKPSLSVDDKDITGFGAPSIELANAKLRIPEVQTAGTLVGSTIRSSGYDTVLELNADLDALFPGVPVGGIDLGLGPVGGLKLEGYDVEGGLTLGLRQDFTLTHDLMVRFDFSAPVLVEGIGPMSFYEGRWDTLPRMAVFEPTLFSPLFWLDAELQNETGLQFGLQLAIEALLLKGTLGFFDVELGPVLEQVYPYRPDWAFAVPFDETFDLAMNGVAALPFLVSPREGGAGLDDSPAPVPLPPGVALLVTALIALPVAARRRRRG